MQNLCWGSNCVGFQMSIFALHGNDSESMALGRYFSWIKHVYDSLWTEKLQKIYALAINFSKAAFESYGDGKRKWLHYWYGKRSVIATMFLKRACALNAWCPQLQASAAPGFRRPRRYDAKMGWPRPGGRLRPLTPDPTNRFTLTAAAMMDAAWWDTFPFLVASKVWAPAVPRLFSAGCSDVSADDKKPHWGLAYRRPKTSSHVSCLPLASFVCLLTSSDCTHSRITRTFFDQKFQHRKRVLFYVGISTK